MGKILNLKFSLNLLFSLIPVSFILGNFAINLNILLIFLFGILILKKEIFLLDNNLEIKLLTSFFVVLIISTIFNYLVFEPNLQNFSFENRVIKSIFFLRYIILSILIYKLLSRNLINFKFFFISSLICCTVLSLDVILQFLSGKNLLGYTSNSINNSGLFGEELIAGGYLSKFSIFSIIFLQIFIAKDNFTKKILAGVLIFLFILSAFYSGNKMPYHMLLLGIILIFLFVKKLRLSIFLGVFLAFISILISMQSNGKLKSYHLSFYNNFKIVSYEVTKKVLIENFGSEEQKKNEKIRTEVYWPVRTGHKQLFLTAIDVWKDSLFFGNGVKSFRIKCSEKQKKLDNRMCDSHPHNFYLEILCDTGIIGLFLILGILFIFFKKYFLVFFKKRGFHENELIFLSCFICIFLELFPFKSSGSFFSTSNSSFIFLIIGILLNKKRLRY